MAADETVDTGSKDRATVSLVLSEVKGLRDFTDAKLTDVQRQLDNLTGLPQIVTGLIETVKHHDEDIRNLRKEHDEDMQAIRHADERRRDYRIGPLMLNLIGGASLLVAVIALVVTHG